jgi:hypothetical protein
MVVSNFDDETNRDPTGDIVANFLIETDKEEPYVDFKETINLSKDAHSQSWLIIASMIVFLMSQSFP